MFEMKQLKEKQLDDGFSLLELSTAVGILLVLTLAGWTGYTGVQKSSRQGAVNSAVEAVYNKAMAHELDADSNTSPKKVENEYNESSEGIVAHVERLGEGRLKVTATYSDGVTKAVRITPKTGNGSTAPNQGNTENPNETPAPIQDVVSKLSYQCDTTTSGAPPVFGLEDGSRVTVLNVNNSGDDKLLTITNGAPSSTTMKAGEQYSVIVEGKFSTLSGGGNIKDCLTGIERLGADTGIETIAKIGGKKFVDVPAEIPSTLSNIGSMFSDASSFNNPNVSKWDTSNITNIAGIFSGATKFNQNISQWDTGNVTDMSYAFNSSGFNNGDQLGESNNPLEWDTSRVTDMSHMFNGAKNFNQHIDKFKTTKVTDMSYMFSGAVVFNQPVNTNGLSSVSNWNTTNVTNMQRMFNNATAFNQPLDKWYTGSVTDMSYMFSLASSFDQPIVTISNIWNTANVTNMQGMFSFTSSFNSEVKIKTSNVTNMSNMFSLSAFNQPMTISSIYWNTSKVTNMSNMFSLSKFNQDLSSLNTSSVTNMQGMFRETNFNNGDVKNGTSKPMKWKTGKVTNMSRMFSFNDDFNQTITSWDLSSVTNYEDMFYYTKQKEKYYPLFEK